MYYVPKYGFYFGEIRGIIKGLNYGITDYSAAIFRKFRRKDRMLIKVPKNLKTFFCSTCFLNFAANTSKALHNWKL